MRANNLIRNSFQLVLVVLFISSCEKNRGKLDLTEQVDFYESNYFGICFSGVYDIGYEEVIISDNESYQKFGNSIRIHPYNLDCDTAILPHIDFNNYTLIGKFTDGGGCEAKYLRQIIDDKENKKIIYKISVEYSGMCAMYIVNMNWARIPKISDNYLIEFQVD